MGSNKVLVTLIFIFFFLIYVTSSSGHFDPWDGISYFFITESMVKKHSVMLYPDLPTVQILSTHSSPIKPAFSNSCWFCDSIIEPTYTGGGVGRALLAPAVAVPFYYAALVFSASPTTVVALFTNSFIMALTCVVLFCFSLALYGSKKIAFVLALIFGVCSFIWPYNTSLLSEPTTTLCVFASAYFIYISIGGASGRAVKDVNKSSMEAIGKIVNKKRTILLSLGALFLGLSVISHPSTIIIIPGFLVYYFFRIRQSTNRIKFLVLFLAVLISVLLFSGLTNYIRFGSVTSFGYGPFQSLSMHSGWQGLVGLLVSPGKGLIFYFPVAILVPLGLVYLYTKSKSVFFLCIYMFVVYWLFFGTFLVPDSPFPDSWAWSGDAWASRYIIPILPFMTLPLGALLVRLNGTKRYLIVSGIIILGIAGFLVNLLGTLVWFAYMYISSVNMGQGHEFMTWNPEHSFIVNYIELLKSNDIQGIQPVKFSLQSYGLAPCPYDAYLYCKIGFLPILAFGATISIVGILILINIGNFKHPLFEHKKLIIK